MSETNGGGSAGHPPECNTCLSYWPGVPDASGKPADGTCHKSAPAVLAIGGKPTAVFPPMPPSGPGSGCSQHDRFAVWVQTAGKAAKATFGAFDPTEGHNCLCVRLKAAVDDVEIRNGVARRVSRKNLTRKDGGPLSCQVNCPACHGTGKTNAAFDAEREAAALRTLGGNPAIPPKPDISGLMAANPANENMVDGDAEIAALLAEREPQPVAR